MDRFKFRVWEVKKNKYREVSKNNADNCIDYLEGKVLYGEGIEIYGEEDDKDVILEQCTGLKDKNGKLIYEGDIVEYMYYDSISRPYRIVWKDYSFMLKPIDETGDCDFERYLYNYSYTNKLEVIGNIHENPELLEVK